MVDEGKIAMTPAVEISYLKPEEQKLLIETIDSEQATPSLSQAQRMKKLSQEGKLSDDTMLGITGVFSKLRRRHLKVNTPPFRSNESRLLSFGVTRESFHCRCKVRWHRNLLKSALSRGRHP